MLAKLRLTLPAFVLGLLCIRVHAQGTQPPPVTAPPKPPAPPAGGQRSPVPPPAVPEPTPPPANAVAATVNGQNITELAVFRATRYAPPGKRDELRGEVVQFLIDNALIDQYLEGLKIAVDAKEVELRLNEIKVEMAKKQEDYHKLLAKLQLTESELRTQIHNTLRWDRFVTQYATDKALKEFFDANRTMFDGSQMKAKHILIKVPANDPKAAEAAKAKVVALKGQIEGQVAAGMKTVAGKDKLIQEQSRLKLLEDAFTAAAGKESDCPSKSAGGELGWFPRAGRMVEPFAKAAFALKPYQMSDVVTTEFGQHLILATDYRPGKDVKFEELKEIVKEVYDDKMRDAVLDRMRPSARIQIHPPPKQ